MRDNEWLKNKLEAIWGRYFSDIPRNNEVIIKFGRRARTRLGSISQKRSRFWGQNTAQSCASKIIINGHFCRENVPLFMVEMVIAHELCHYAHGFSSPLPQLSKYPHHGGVVDKELKNRGLSQKLILQKKWLKTEWTQIVKNSKFETRNPKQIRNYKKRKIKTVFDLLFGL